MGALAGRAGPHARRRSALLATAIVLGLPATVLAGSALAAPPALAAAPLANGPCGGPSVASTFSGTLGVQGGSAPPSVANQTIRVLYAYQLDYTPNGGSTSTSCSTGSSTAVTDAQGRFSITLSIPSSGCSVSGCANYSGPFGPTGFSVTSPTPAGYFVTAAVNGSTVSLDFVLALGSAGLSPFGRTTVSSLAPVTLTASGIAGNGDPSPATLTYAWTVTGTGWTVLAGAGTDQLTVLSSSGAGIGNIVVYVNGTYNGTTLSAAPRSAALNAVATSLVGASVAPTSLDAGTPATFTLSGSGAAGYPYTATVLPGLGGAPVSAPCRAVSAPGGLVSLNCTVSVVYAQAGVAQPAANLSNGYSTATWTAPFSLTVSSALGVEVTPAPAQGYAGSPIRFTVSVAAGTGTAPFGPACFWPGDGSLSCSAVGGSSWTFDTTFGRAGTFAGTVTVADSAGANRSTAVLSIIAVPPTLSALSANTSSFDAGTPLAIASVYSGGALPATYWWNDSLPGTTLYRGVLTADGPLLYTFVPSVAGDQTVTLTVVDALGTVVAQPLHLTVLPGPASRIVSVNGPGAWATEAGVPYNVSWAIIDPAGDVVPNGGVPLTLTPGALAGPLWVNLTWGPSLPPGPAGAFTFSPSDWRMGYLNFTIDPERAAPVTLAVASSLPIAEAPTGSVTLVVTADLHHLLLQDPTRLGPGGAENQTLWRISDRFQNPIPTGYVVVLTEVGGAVSQTKSPIHYNGTVSVVWVNFTLPPGLGGSVVVLSPWGQLLLPQITFPTSTAASPPELAILLGLAAVAIACLAVGVRRQRMPGERAPPPAPAPAPEGPDDAALRRLAEGRAYVLYRADPEEPRELAELVRGFPGLPPTATELTEWVGSLVNEGALRASVGPDGKPRFARVTSADAKPSAAPPRIEVDPAAFEAALARRPEPEEPDRDDGPPPA